MVDEQRRRDGSSQGDGTIRGDVGKTEDAEAEIDSEGQQGQDESDGGGANEQIHKERISRLTQLFFLKRSHPAGATHQVGLPNALKGAIVSHQVHYRTEGSRIQQRRNSLL